MLYGELPISEVLNEENQKIAGVTIRIQNPPKIAVLGLPTSAHISERLTRQKSIRKTLGRRKSQTDFIPDTSYDLTIFNQIRRDKGEEFNEFEAAAAIAKILDVEITELEKTGDGFNITLKTIFGLTTHTVSQPTQKALQVYRRTVISSIDLPHGMEEIRYKITPPCDLYDSIAKNTTGYLDRNAIPPHHKSMVAIEVAQSMDEIDIVQDPNS